MLKLNRSSFYKWKNSSSARRKRLMSDAILGARVKTVFAVERGCYGAKRITAELKDQAGHDPVNHKRVARVMRELKLFGYTKKRKVTTTVSDQKKPVFPDLVGRKFTADKPNQLLTSGTSPTCRFRMGRICTWPRLLIVILSRLVGFSIADHMRTSLVQDALLMAKGQRGSLKGAIFHSDHGSVYTSHAFQDTCKELGIEGSQWDQSAPVRTTR
nr:IS3 family transposase [Corynebacterium faecale]